MTISDKIYINGAHTGAWDSEAVKDACTYANPDYMNAKRLGFSTHNIPRTIQTWSEKNDILAVERGEIRKVLSVVKDESLIELGVDTPAEFTYENKDFELDQHQMGAVAAIVSHKQGIIHAVTSAGKTHIVLAAAAKLGKKTLILVHRKILMEQFLTDIKKYIKVDGRPIEDGEYGAIGGSSKVSRKATEITVAMVQTLSKYPLVDMIEVQSHGAVFCDENHLCPATTFSKVVNSLPASRRYGLTGTLKRKDQKDFLIYATFGQVIAEINKEQLLALDRVSPVETKIVATDFTLSDLDKEESVTERWARSINEIHTDKDRMELVLDEVDRGRTEGGATLVLLNRVEAVYEFESAYRRRGKTDCGAITGANSKEALDVFNRTLSGSNRVIFATIGCVSTGVSIPHITHIILASPIFNNEALLHQCRGRGMRVAEGKEKCVFTFIWDPLVFEQYKLTSFKRIMAK